MKKVINVCDCSFFMERNTAFIVSIKDILSGSYHKTKEEMASNYVSIKGQEVSRVNVVAVVITVSQDQERPITRITIEDGTSSIQLLDFEQKPGFSSLQPGDLVLVIGKIRAYNNLRYILPEIIKKVKPKWAAYRKKQLAEHAPARDEEPAPVPQETSRPTVQVTEESMDEEVVSLPEHEVLKIVDKLDTGDGADVDEVIRAMNKEGAESLIDAMLKEGDIFQIKPGRIKIL